MTDRTIPQVDGGLGLSEPGPPLAMKKRPFIVGLDFDGTCVQHDYPNIGPEVEFCIDWLRILQKEGARLMLWTMRDRSKLQEAVDWFNQREITLWGINLNPEQARTGWSESRKQFAHCYIDDTAIGTPLIYPGGHQIRPYVNWQIVGPQTWARMLSH